MTLQTPTQPATTAPRPAVVRPPGGQGLLHPTGMAELTKRELYREFLRWPTLLWLPATVAILTVVALQSYVAAVPVALVLATAATLHAVHRACARMTTRFEIAAVTGLIPFQRSGNYSERNPL